MGARSKLGSPASPRQAEKQTRAGHLFGGAVPFSSGGLPVIFSTFQKLAGTAGNDSHERQRLIVL